MRKTLYISPLWIITLLAVVTSGYLSWQWWGKQGPEITISFNDASGLVPGQSGIYYRGAKVGKVTAIVLGQESEIMVTARMQRMAVPFLKQGTDFWIARPELNLQGIRNLSSIASGSTIRMKAGQGGGKPLRHFTGKDEAPPAIDLSSAMLIVLKAEKLGSVAVGSPVTFRDVKTGEVTQVEVAEDGGSVLISARVYRKYAPLIRENTVFWDDGGVNTSLSLFGASTIYIPSLSALVSGRIAFANKSDGKSAREGQVFPMLRSKPEG